MKKSLFSKKNVIIAVAILLLIFLHILGFLSPLENLIIKPFNNLGGFFHTLSLKVNQGFKPSPEKKTLEKELEEMKLKYYQVLAEQAKCEQVYKENRELQDYLDFNVEHDYSHIMAEITSKDNFLVAGKNEFNLYLNKGIRDGLEVGMAVINREGVVVGKIINVSKESSQACLTINSDCKLAAGIINNDETSGIVSGNLGLTISMDLIPQNQEIKEGDLIISSGLENNIPAGLLIGVVSRVDKQNNEIWQKAVLEPLYNADELRLVLVIKP